MRRAEGRAEQRPGPAEELAEHYRDDAVRARLAEYCGAEPNRIGTFSAWGIAGYGGRLGLTEPDGGPVPRGRDLAPLLLDGADVCRSLADAGGTLLQLDVDYTHPAAPTEPYRDPATCFARLEPVYEAVGDAFLAYGIRPLVAMTARGYHFTVRAPSGSPLQTGLLGLGVLPDSLRERYEAMAGAVPGAPRMGRAHHGAGKLLEHLCHRVMRELAGRSALPVTIADVPPPGLGPFVCLDITAYGDPLFTRFARCAFSGNQKAWVKGIARDRPFVITLTRDRETLDMLLRAREDRREAARLAQAACARIPDAVSGVRWIEDYRRSALARFHRAFEQGPHADPSTWGYTYDALDLERLPACARLPLQFPNPALLMPVYLRTVARVLSDQGWHPRSVAEIVRSRYARDHAWGSLWRRNDPGARAAFYTRVLLGALVAGVDDASDFTCETQAQRGVCSREGCGFDLARLRPPRRPLS